MVEFAVPIVRLDDVSPHPDADRLDICTIGGFKSIVMRDVYKTGDLVVYIPENAIVPQELLEAQGLSGALSGSQRNRVKPKRLRGIFSEGLVFPVSVLLPTLQVTEAYEEDEGFDVSELLGITKYEPQVPTHFAGQVFVPTNMSVNGDLPIKYDIENIKKFQDILHNDEEVVITEKIHGTFMQVGYDQDMEPSDDMFGDYGQAFVVSKGLGAKGMIFKNSEENRNNVYVRACLQEDLFEIARDIAIRHGVSKAIICGEVFGSGVQDLTYGAEQDQLKFRAFDIYVHDAKGRRFVNYNEFDWLTTYAAVRNAPILARDTWGNLKPHLDHYTNGPTVITTKPVHIREGCVIRPMVERRHERYGRVIYKSISEAYLLRKNGTELN